MKLIIDIPEDMYKDANILIVKDLPELKKIIANGIPYDDKERGEGMTGYNELREGQEFYGNGYKQGFIDALDKAFTKFDANVTYSGDVVLQKLEILKEEMQKGGAE